MIARGLAAAGVLLVVAAVGVGLVLAATTGEPPPIGSESARRLESGPFRAGRAPYEFIDETRVTPANGDLAEQPRRSLSALLWYPEGDPSDHPLVVYSHGFLSDKEEASAIAEQLASHGFVVVSPDHPLTSRHAPDRPFLADFINQPGDLSFLIDSVLALDGADKPFEGRVDPDRIGVVGLSLGGLTATLAAFHPELRDPRIGAAVSIAGPSSFFAAEFFENAAVPFLMIAGSEDAMVDYDEHARPILERAPGAALLTIEGGSHMGFADGADPLFRFLDHPDGVGCHFLLEGLAGQEQQDPFAALGGAEQGILTEEASVLPCSGELGRALHPGRQHTIALLAVTSFLRGQLESEPAARATAWAHLSQILARDFPEVRYEAAPRRARTAERARLEGR